LQLTLCREPWGHFFVRVRGCSWVLLITQQ
jgi:hypothetical protein